MRQTIFAVVVLSAVGIRRWPSVDVVEDLTRELIKGGHNKLVSTIQSLLQNQDVAGWSSNSSALTAAITRLSDEVVITLTNENSAAQTTITKKTNNFQIAINNRKSVEGAARAAEQTLAEAVEKEKQKAEAYWKGREQLGTDMVAAFEPCKLQENLTDFQHTLTPQTSFLCDFSSTNSGGCTQKFATFESNMDGMVEGLNASMIAAQSQYAAAVAACSGAINTADASMGELIAAYDSWSVVRENVSAKHSSRRSTVCDSDCDGLSGAIALECSARTRVMSTHTRTNSDNNTDSLADRNYELQSLEVVDCLLKKLQGFGNDEFDGSNVNAIVSDCQQRKDWDDYVLDWNTSDGHAGDCETNSTAGDDLSVLTGSTLCDDTALSVAFETADLQGVMHTNQQSMHIEGMIPWNFNGQVQTPEQFQVVSADGSHPKTFCQQGDPHTYGRRSAYVSGPDMSGWTLKSWYMGPRYWRSGFLSKCEEMCSDDPKCNSWMTINSAKTCYLSEDSVLQEKNADGTRYVDHHPHTFGQPVPCSDPCSDWCPEGEANCLQDTLRTLTCTGNDQATKLVDISKVQVTDLFVPKGGDYQTPSTSDRSFETTGLVEGCSNN